MRVDSFDFLTFNAGQILGRAFFKPKAFWIWILLFKSSLYANWGMLQYTQFLPPLRGADPLSVSPHPFNRLHLNLELIIFRYNHGLMQHNKNVEGVLGGIPLLKKLSPEFQYRWSPSILFWHRLWWTYSECYFRDDLVYFNLSYPATLIASAGPHTQLRWCWSCAVVIVAHLPLIKIIFP